MVAVWPERGYGVDFFEKSSEHGYSNWSKIDEKLSEMEPIQPFGACLVLEMTGEAQGTVWNQL